MRRVDERRRLPGAWLLALCFGVLPVLGAAPARGDADDLPPGVVARVEGEDVAYDDLCGRVVDHVRGELRLAESGPSIVLRRLVEERVVARAAREQGIEAAPEDVDRAVADLARDVRVRSGGASTLEDALRAQGRTLGDLRRQIAHRFRLAALEERGHGLAGLRAAARVLYALPTADGPRAEGLAPEVVATVDGDPVSRRDFGREVLAGLGTSRAHALIERECKVRLVAARGIVLTEEDLRAEMAHTSRIVALERSFDFDAEEVWRTTWVRDGARVDAEPSLDDALHGPYERSLLALLRHLREGLHAHEVRSEHARQAESVYGPSILVWHLAFPFADGPSPFLRGPARTRAEARALAGEAAHRLRRGEAPEALAAAWGGAGTEDVVVRRAHLRATNRDRLLFERARGLEDGEVGAPFETLAEVNVLRRERAVPAPAFEEVEPVVRERLARQRARRWLEEAVSDPSRVRIRWPPGP